jgi:hypothetical protein
MMMKRFTELWYFVLFPLIWIRKQPSE